MKTRLLLLLMFISINSFSQFSVNESFESGLPSGWTSTDFVANTGGACAGTSAMRKQFSQASPFGGFTTSNFISNGNAISFSVQYSIQGSGTVSVETSYVVNNVNTAVITNGASAPTTSCQTITFTIPAGAAPAGSQIKFNFGGFRQSLTTFLNYDNIIINQIANPIIPEQIANYPFNNSLNNAAGNSPFSAANTSFVNNRTSQSQSAIRVGSTTAPSTATIANLPLASSERTISFWHKKPAHSVPVGLFAYGTAAAGKTFGLYLAANGNYVFQNSVNDVTFTNSSTGAGVWVHSVLTFNNGFVKLYNNGTFVNGNQNVTLNTENSTFRLGGNGAIVEFDDLQIYNYELTAAEVGQLYSNNALQVTLPTISSISVPATTPDGATINYDINANNGTTTSIVKYGLTSGNLSSQINGFSASGSAFTSGSAQIQGLLASTTYFYQIEATNSAGSVTSTIGSFTTSAFVEAIAEYNFNNTYNNILGTNPFQANGNTSFTTDRNNIASSAININDSGTTATILGLPYGSSPRTISVWAKINVLNNQINYVFHYGTSGNGNALALRPANTLYFANAAANLETPGTTSINTWVHYVCTYDGTTAKVYKNGLLFSSGPKTFNTLNNSNVFKLGLSEDGFATYFNGAIDDLKIYNYAISQSEVTSLYNNNTLASTDFEENNLKVSLFPNPVNDVLNVETATEIKSVEIYNLQGQKVHSAGSKQINVSDLAAGIYIIKVQDVNNGIATQRLIKK